jgi:hypothetical protein
MERADRGAIRRRFPSFATWSSPSLKAGQRCSFTFQAPVAGKRVGNGYAVRCFSFWLPLPSRVPSPAFARLKGAPVLEHAKEPAVGERRMDVILHR